MSSKARLSGVREYFALRAAEARGSGLSDRTREALSLDARRATERHRAAIVLWNGGAAAQALRLVREALELHASVARRALGEDDLAASLAAAGLEASEAQELAKLVEALGSTPAPELDADVSAHDASSFRRACDACARASGALSTFAATPRDLRRLRRTRAGRGVLVLALTVVAALLLVRGLYRTDVYASAVYGAPYEPANVTDGNPDSEWLLPNNTLGWIDLAYSPRRKVSRVRLLNSHNFDHVDRATKELRVEVYRKGQLVKAVDAAFTQIVAAPSWLDVDLGGKLEIDRVRIVIKSYFVSGAGLAEVAVD